MNRRRSNVTVPAVATLISLNDEDENSPDIHRNSQPNFGCCRVAWGCQGHATDCSRMGVNRAGIGAGPSHSCGNGSCAGDPDLITFGGEQQNPLDWTRDFATPIFPSTPPHVSFVACPTPPAELAVAQTAPGDLVQPSAASVSQPATPQYGDLKAKVGGSLGLPAVAASPTAAGLLSSAHGLASVPGLSPEQRLSPAPIQDSAMSLASAPQGFSPTPQECSMQPSLPRKPSGHWCGSCVDTSRPSTGEVAGVRAAGECSCDGSPASTPTSQHSPHSSSPPPCATAAMLAASLFPGAAPPHARFATHHEAEKSSTRQQRQAVSTSIPPPIGASKGRADESTLAQVEALLCCGQIDDAVLAGWRGDRDAWEIVAAGAADRHEVELWLRAGRKPSDSRASGESGHFESPHLGLTLSARRGYALVVDVAARSAAKASGLCPGDIICAVGGDALFSCEGVAQALRPLGTCDVIDSSGRLTGRQFAERDREIADCLHVLVRRLIAQPSSEAREPEVDGGTGSFQPTAIPSASLNTAASSVAACLAARAAALSSTPLAIPEEPESLPPALSLCDGRHTASPLSPGGHGGQGEVLQPSTPHENFTLPLHSIMSAELADAMREVDGLEASAPESSSTATTHEHGISSHLRDEDIDRASTVCVEDVYTPDVLDVEHEDVSSTTCERLDIGSAPAEVTSCMLRDGSDSSSPHNVESPSPHSAMITEGTLSMSGTDPHAECARVADGPKAKQGPTITGEMIADDVDDIKGAQELGSDVLESNHNMASCASSVAAHSSAQQPVPPSPAQDGDEGADVASLGDADLEWKQVEAELLEMAATSVQAVFRGRRDRLRAVATGMVTRTACSWVDHTREIFVEADATSGGRDSADSVSSEATLAIEHPNSDGVQDAGSEIQAVGAIDGVAEMDLNGEISSASVILASCQRICASDDSAAFQLDLIGARRRDSMHEGVAMAEEAAQGEVAGQMVAQLATAEPSPRLVDDASVDAAGRASACLSEDEEGQDCHVESEEEEPPPYCTLPPTPPTSLDAFPLPSSSRGTSPPIRPLACPADSPPAATTSQSLPPSAGASPSVSRTDSGENTPRIPRSCDLSAPTASGTLTCSAEAAAISSPPPSAPQPTLARSDSASTIASLASSAAQSLAASTVASTASAAERRAHSRAEARAAAQADREAMRDKLAHEVSLRQATRLVEEQRRAEVRTAMTTGRACARNERNDEKERGRRATAAFMDAAGAVLDDLDAQLEQRSRLPLKAHRLASDVDGGADGGALSAAGAAIHSSCTLRTDDFSNRCACHSPQSPTCSNAVRESSTFDVDRQGLPSVSHRSAASSVAVSDPFTSHCAAAQQTLASTEEDEAARVMEAVRAEIAAARAGIYASGSPASSEPPPLCLVHDTANGDGAVSGSEHVSITNYGVEDAGTAGRGQGVDDEDKVLRLTLEQSLLDARVGGETATALVSGDDTGRLPHVVLMAPSSMNAASAGLGLGRASHADAPGGSVPLPDNRCTSCRGTLSETSVDALRDMSEQDQLAYALALSRDAIPTPVHPAECEQLNDVALGSATARDAMQHATTPNDVGVAEPSEDEQLAWALSASMDASSCCLTSSHPEATMVHNRLRLHSADDASRVATPLTLRIFIQGASEVAPIEGRRDTHMVYQLEAWFPDASRVASPHSCAHRFSSFVDLLSKLTREAPGERVSREARACIDRWRSRLLVEKRHTRSKAPAVVTARVALLQRMLDELLAFADIRESTALVSFLMA